MIDSWNRTIDYIRISITDRCNLRCVYCMPEEGVETLAHSDILSYEEIGQLCKVLRELGIKKVKLTGGEPLVRKGVADLVRMLKQECRMEQVTMTTNGILLASQVRELVEAGLDGVNISLDTLDAQQFQFITRRDALNQVLKGLKASLDCPGLNVKLNCVPQTRERDTVLQIAELAREKNLSVRYIEIMPIGLGRDTESFSEEEILQILTEEYGTLTPYGKKIGNGPAHYYTIEGFRGKIGFISAISHKFCSKCNRIRLTANGFLKTCLQYDTGVDLRELLRNGTPKTVWKAAVETAIQNKPQEHHFHEETREKSLEQHGMSQIGG